MNGRSLSLTLSLFLISLVSCKKSTSGPTYDAPPPVVTSLSNYLVKENSSDNFVSLITSSRSEPTAFKVADSHKDYFYTKADSLFINPEGKNLLIASKRLDMNLRVMAKDTTQQSFTLVLDQFLKNRVIAHRGAWKISNNPENSMAALKHAIDIGSAASEFDVWLTADKIIVVNHDRMFNGMDIETSTYSQLKSARLPNGEYIPTLVEYINEIKKQQQTRLYLEIKGSYLSSGRNLEVADEAVRTVNKLNAQAWVTYTSLNAAILDRILSIDKFAQTLYCRGDYDLDQVRTKNYVGIHYEISRFKNNTTLFKQAKSRGLVTVAWTVDDLTTMKWLINGGVNGITTNEPEMLISYLSKKGE